jgi:epoxyqueuosine reductase
MTDRLSEVWPALVETARAEGVLALGASPLEIDSHHSLLEEWLAAERHATMGYLRKSETIRRDPAARFPWGRSVISILVPYSAERPTDGSIASHVARYALGDDYHDVLDEILQRFEAVIKQMSPEGKTWRYVDTGPLSDRSYAAAAGLGWIAKNSMLINDRHGSYFFIGLLVTSLDCDIEADLVTDRCGTCTRCIDACPTDAILPDRTVESNRCISHATIEQRGPLDDVMKAALGTNVFGCDICQEVCPWNRKAPESHPRLAPREEYRARPISDLLALDQQGFSTLFRKSAVKRAKRVGMLRNALIVSTTVPDDEFVDSETDPGIADARAWRRR